MGFRSGKSLASAAFALLTTCVGGSFGDSEGGVLLLDVVADAYLSFAESTQGSAATA